jgi:hypothetical protein
VLLEEKLKAMCTQLADMNDCEAVVLIIKQQGLKPMAVTLGAAPECLNLLTYMQKRMSATLPKP